MSYTYQDETTTRLKNIQTIHQATSFWVTKTPEESRWETELLLNHDFFEEISQNPVPIDLRAIQSIRKSPLAIDMYCWFTYRMFTLRRETLIPWDKLFVQFGVGYANNKSGRYAFRKNFLEQLKYIRALYSGLCVNENERGLVLRPSLPHIRKKK